jgi:DNA helicase HerA-like ATPase
MGENGILVGKGRRDLHLLPALANRHGLIAGATGTGKTVTLRVMAEGFSEAGVPVFVADVKGDLAGLAMPGEPNARLAQRAAQLGLPPLQHREAPVVFWDVFGEQGHPVRTTVSEMGPLLLARLLDLNETQAGVLNLVFTVADDEGMLLLDLKDLRAMLTFVAENAKALTTEYGNVSAQSIGAIQRALLAIETQGGDLFFGEPALALDDLMLTDPEGRGAINVLAGERLMHSPKLYATFLLWLLSELFEQLPEAGDLDKPKLVFFFDEAHLLFDDAPKALVGKVEQVVRLIRSKGVGVYFVTQSPLDIPDAVLGQLGNRVQHALRAFTPRDQKAVRAAAETFRASPGLDVATAITELAVGEALVSLLDSKGIPVPVERALIAPPVTRLGPITPEERAQVVASSPRAGVYEQRVDRESAYEILRGTAARRTDEAASAGTLGTGWSWSNPWGTAPADPAQTAGGGASVPASAPRPRGGIMDAMMGSTGPRGGRREGIVEVMAKSAMRSVGSQIGRQIARGILGGILGR